MDAAFGLPNSQENNVSSNFENAFYLFAALLFTYMLLTILGRRSEKKLNEKPTYSRNNFNNGGETAN